MAQWIPRGRTDGGVSIQIKWRMDGRWQSETFTDPRAAAELRLAVEQAGHRWPDGWIKRHGWAVRPRRVLCPPLPFRLPPSPTPHR